tara:strand:+ start:12159 stop:12635 length:477 start_codon:yes stop_codon:yes gene_type:complete
MKYVFTDRFNINLFDLDEFVNAYKKTFIIKINRCVLENELSNISNYKSNVVVGFDIENKWLHNNIKKTIEVDIKSKGKTINYLHPEYPLRTDSTLFFLQPSSRTEVKIYKCEFLSTIKDEKNKSLIEIVSGKEKDKNDKKELWEKLTYQEKINIMKGG